MAIITVDSSEKGPDPAFPSLLLINPKFSGNVINAHRLCACFGVPQVWCTGDRVGHDLDRGRKTRIPPEERLRGFGKVDLIWCERAFEILRASDALVVGVEISEGARSLLEFEHHAPHHGGRICYVFGSEDASLGDEITAACDALPNIAGGRRRSRSAPPSPQLIATSSSLTSAWLA